MTTEKLSMKAVLPVEGVTHARNYGGEKETVTRYCVVGRLNGRLQSVIEARMYMGRSRTASTVYCSLWVSGAKVYTTGSGTASGWGYHKESAALEAAIRSAGIELYGSNYAYNGEKVNFKARARIGGCGSGSMETALKAIARAVGVRGQILIV